MLHIRIWQWPNLLALDAALIAVAWQAVFAHLLSTSPSAAAQLVLGLSVWLTYMADRLFDVTKRSSTQLLSTRHRFAKLHAHGLWRLWWTILCINTSIAAVGLEYDQLRNGTCLLVLCLLYTALNQALSRHFFPKEICVAIIYAGGIIVFLLPNAGLWAPSVALALLCFINCLMISVKEQGIDAALQVRTISRINPRWLLLLQLICGLSLFVLERQWIPTISLALGALILTQTFQKYITVERFRVLTDSALLISPVIYLVLHL